MATNEPRKKWTRARAPRVRTGCITCKIRHLKCDEAKPVCQRCIKDKQKCDGYQEPKAPVPKTKKPLRLIQFQPKQKGAACRALAALRPAPSIANLACPTDAALFYHAREYTIREFDVLSCSKFWHDFVLPLAHTVEPVKHALCALGGAHRRFVTGYPGDSNSSSAAVEFELASIQKYNQAIMHIKPLMVDSSESNLQTTLICCIIFICIENLLGRYTDAIRHLHAGCQLLNSLRLEGQVGHSLLPHSNDPNFASVEHNLFDIVTEMFWRLGQNVAIYVGDEIFLDLDVLARTVEMGDPQVPFSSLFEADIMLDRIDDIYDDCLLSASPESWMIQKAFDQPLPASIVHDARKTALSAARESFDVWNSRFELLKQNRVNVKPTPDDQRVLGFLSLHQAIWSTLTKYETIDEEFSREDSTLILDRAEALIRLDGDKTSPVFAFNGYLIPAISIVCASCRDVDMQRRAISMLRGLRRREGVWDSSQVAEVYETMVEASVQERVDWETLPWGIPQLAAELSGLTISAGSSPDGRGQAA